ncbi:hypothetical protein D3H65_04405 [Paraflavitalea soli]|uniref:Uncharacterized protein n=1 Tax=Paraflavitalea soli TaxID=2315862 RepID=A0A3B7MG02_9BACT|nr:hypothetical protein [Paraflavitalea soli]AXY73264.1 hypothetical protein D3H65_04405 [Paraflavitalea soli]
MPSFTKMIFPAIIGALLLTSCATINISDRNKVKTDQQLTSTDIAKLNGTFTNKANDSLPLGVNTLWDRLFNHPEPMKDRWAHATVKLEVASPTAITLSLMDADKLIDTRTVRFKYKKGYIKLRTQMNGKMLVGPLLWGLQVSKSYLGLTVDNQLILLNSKGGTLMVICVPAFGSGGENDIAYRRVE